MAIYVIDEMMGRGKTTAAIRMVSESDSTHPYLFIVPYLTEIERIKHQVVGRTFIDPDQYGGKLNNIKPLFKERCDIVSTHALFQSFDHEIIELIQSNGYILIMDEVANVASQIDITQQDSTNILEKYAHVDSEQRLVWDDRDYDGRLSIYRDIMDTKNAYMYNGSYWVSMMTIDLFLAFEDIYILTYMFEHQIHRCYFDLFGVKYQYKYVVGDSYDTYRFSDVPGLLKSVDLRGLIRIEYNEKLNEIGSDYYDLSKQWYRNNSYSPKMTRLGNNVLNFFRNYARTPGKKNLWTTFGEDSVTKIDYFKLLAGGGFARSGIPCNAKGTNDYRDRTSLAYLINRFPNTNLYNFLSARGIELNRDAFALSEMIQWIWRSAIRDGEDVYLYMPSYRMRTLLENWLNRLAEGGDTGGFAV